MNASRSARIVFFIDGSGEPEAEACEETGNGWGEESGDENSLKNGF